MSDIPDPCNLIVNYIPTPVTDAELYAMFQQFGELVSARVIVDRVTKHPKGYGFVKFRDIDCARKAMEDMNGFDILGKRLKVTPARGHQAQQIDAFLARPPPASAQAAPPYTYPGALPPPPHPNAIPPGSMQQNAPPPATYAMPPPPSMHQVTHHHQHHHHQPQMVGSGSGAPPVTYVYPPQQPMYAVPPPPATSGGAAPPPNYGQPTGASAYQLPPYPLPAPASQTAAAAHQHHHYHHYQHSSPLPAFPTAHPSNAQTAPPQTVIGPNGESLYLVPATLSLDVNSQPQSRPSSYDAWPTASAGQQQSPQATNNNSAVVQPPSADGPSSAATTQPASSATLFGSHQSQQPSVTGAASNTTPANQPVAAFDPNSLSSVSNNAAPASGIQQ